MRRSLESQALSLLQSSARRPEGWMNARRRRDVSIARMYDVFGLKKAQKQSKTTKSEERQGMEWNGMEWKEGRKEVFVDEI